MPLAFAEATVPRSRPCALAGVGRRCLSASKLLYLGFMWEQEMKLEDRLNSLSLILWHPDCAPGLRFPGGQDEDWLWSLGFSLGEVNGKCGSKAVLQRALGQPPHLSQFGSLQFHCLILFFFSPQRTFLYHHHGLLCHSLFIISPSLHNPVLPSNFSPNSSPHPQVGCRGCHSLSIPACFLALVLGEY